MKEPKKIKLSETPTSKDVKKIPLPPISANKYDLDMVDDVYSKTEYQNLLKTNLVETNNENNPENNSESIQQLESYETD